MKTIINGKRYDTETATLIEEFNNRLGGRDFRNCIELLYLKKTGEFFLHGEGGPMSRWAISNGNTSSGGEALEPLNLDEAKHWVETHANDQYEELFGEVAE